MEILVIILFAIHIIGWVGTVIAGTWAGARLDVSTVVKTFYKWELAIIQVLRGKQ